MKKKEFSTIVGGKTLTATFSDLAERANGSVMLRYGNTVVLATAVMSKESRDGEDFLPLTVDYEEKFYASGQILGSRFVRREGKPSDEAILSGRIVDRTIRPLFDHWIRNEIQSIITVLSIEEDDPDMLGIWGASLAIGTSHIPWNGPVSAIRLAKMKGDDNFIINPSYKIREDKNLEFELVACGKDGKINMIELGGNEVPEETVAKALQFASEEIEKVQDFQNKIIKEIGKKKLIIPKPETPKELTPLFKEIVLAKLEKQVFTGVPGDTSIEALKKEWLTAVEEKFPGTNINLPIDLFEDATNEIVHTEAIENNRRADGRKIDEIRPLYAQAGGISPILHGSGIFYRGQTHILTALTLGGPSDTQIIDGIEEKNVQKRFMHHYNFPPFSTGETGRASSTNRRMIGHGALAEKALVPIIPDQEQFPYTIRLVSEALSSNGSTSMGSVCGSTLALMDGGVPIKKPVAGIASGLMLSEDGKKYKVLTDIQGPEDHYGDMDFKVAGTLEGITAMQMDVKVGGIPLSIFPEALEKARLARIQILKVITEAILEPRPEICAKAPKILIIRIKPDQIGGVIGSGGKTINDIKEKTGVEAIDIEDDGKIFITGKNGSAEKAKKIIEEMTHEYKRGEKFQGEVVKILDFGAFVRIGYNAEGLVHISEIAPFRVDRVTAVLKEGDKVPVVVKEIDERGRISLSIKQADPNFVKQPGKV
ncbi:MAG: polyribonucleotide nucleotidyltransferase [Candidatus Paceibacterota bacterium]